VFFPCWARNSLLGPDSLLCQRGRAGGPSRESGPGGNSGQARGWCHKAEGMGRRWAVRSGM
jgi:hypothetical protein